MLLCVKIYVIMCEPHFVKLFFVKILHSTAVFCLFYIQDTSLSNYEGARVGRGGSKGSCGGSMGGCDMYQLHISYSITPRFRWDTWVTGHMVMLHMGDRVHG